ncbi:hypothetical protein ACLOJK_004487 [Asimina triloba]
MAAVVEVPDGGPLRCLGFAGKNRCPSAWIVAGLGDGRRELADGAVRVGSLRLLPAGAPAGCLKQRRLPADVAQILLPLAGASWLDGVVMSGQRMRGAARFLLL